jgi:hypothetical protein
MKLEMPQMMKDSGAPGGSGGGAGKEKTAEDAKQNAVKEKNFNYLKNNLGEYEANSIPAEIAFDMVAYPNTVLNNLNKFNGLSVADLVKHIVDNSGSGFLVANLNKIPAEVKPIAISLLLADGYTAGSEAEEKNTLALLAGGSHNIGVLLNRMATEENPKRRAIKSYSPQYLTTLIKFSEDECLNETFYQTVLQSDFSNLKSVLEKNKGKFTKEVQEKYFK